MKKTIVVTGASGGIGLELSKNMLDEGYNVVSQCRTNIEQITDVFKLRNLDVKKHVHVVDLTSEEQVTNFAEKVIHEHGQVWGVVNLAGTSTNSMSWTMSIDQFKKIIDDNLLTTFMTCRAFIPHMRSFSQGRIINTSSVVAYSGVAGASHYCAAKAAISGFSKAISIELAPKNITVNVLALGYFDAGMISQVNSQQLNAIKEKTPLRRFGSHDDVRHAVSYLLNDSSSFMTGQVIHLNGGLL